MNIGKILGVFLAFFVMGILISGNNSAFDRPSPLSDIIGSFPNELPSPSDRISEDQIHVYDTKVVIEVPNAEWATFADTNSMDPVIDYGSNAIELVPKSADDIRVGDIVSYQSEYASGTIIHRVIEIGQDEKGTYFIMKGDNVKDPDPGRVRFSQVKRVVVAIIY